MFCEVQECQISLITYHIVLDRDLKFGRGNVVIPVTSYQNDFAINLGIYSSYVALYVSVYIFIIAICLKNNTAGFSNSGQYIPACIYLLYVQFRLIAKAVVIGDFSLCCPVLRVPSSHCFSENCLARMLQNWFAVAGMGGESALH